MMGTDKQQAAELFAALLLYCPSSTTMQMPALDLRSTQPCLADLNAPLDVPSAHTHSPSISHTIASDPTADRTIEVPHRVGLMKQWRGFLGHSIQAQGYCTGETEIKVENSTFWGIGVVTFAPS